MVNDLRAEARVWRRDEPLSPRLLSCISWSWLHQFIHACLSPYQALHRLSFACQLLARQ